MNDTSDKRGASGVSPAFIDELAVNQPALYAYITALLAGDVESAKDVLQEMDLYIWNNSANYDAAKGPFLPWARAMARAQVQKARNASRRERARTVYADDVFDLVATRAAEESEPPNDRLHALRECLKGLSPQERSLLGRHYAKGEKLDTLAASCRMTLAALKMKLLRLRDCLGACIRDHLCRMDRGEEELPDTPSEFDSSLSMLLDDHPVDSRWAAGESFNVFLRDDPSALHRFLVQVDVHALLAYASQQDEARVVQRRAAWRYAAKRVGWAALAAACLALLVGGGVRLFTGGKNTAYRGAAREQSVTTALSHGVRAVQPSMPSSMPPRPLLPDSFSPLLY